MFVSVMCYGDILADFQCILVHEAIKPAVGFHRWMQEVKLLILGNAETSLRAMFPLPQYKLVKVAVLDGIDPQLSLETKVGIKCFVNQEGPR